MKSLLSWIGLGKNESGPSAFPALYRFRVQRNGYKKNCRIAIRGDQSLTELDQQIRKKMRLNTWDHCSAFFAGEAWRSKCLGEVYPDGSGPHQKRRIEGLKLKPGQPFEYIYDFGDNLDHTLVLEAVEPIFPGLPLG